MRARDIIAYLNAKYDWDWDKIYNAIKEKEDVGKDIGECPWGIITIIDEAYPERLKHGFKPPFAIGFSGDPLLAGRRETIFTDDDGIFDEMTGKKLTAAKISKGLIVISDGESSVTLKCGNGDEAALRTAGAIAGKYAFRNLDSESKSGLMVMSWALSNGADIYVMPGKPGGISNKAIKEGAYLFDCIEDLMD